VVLSKPPRGKALLSVLVVGDVEMLKGSKHTEEAIQKMREIKLGKIASEETRKRMRDASTGELNPRWNGGKYIDGDGYISTYSPDHPNASCDNRVLEHRLVMEKFLSRYLTPTEIVHHSDGDKTNNSIKNLVLFPSVSEHMIYHHTQRTEEKERCIKNEAMNVPATGDF
jgi:hypothetical protein